MKKLNKKDLIRLAIICLSFLIYVFVLTNFKYYYGSTLDWYEQHVAFPEYFRDLFYKTKQLFPDFAFNIGNGQNIYNFSYYGLLSPVVLVSYLLPFVNMTSYMIFTTILSVIVSGMMMYYWLKNKGNSENISLFGALLLMFSTSMSFHSHRHIMFMNYMPFLMLGLFGADRKLEHQRSCMLAISVFLMVMTSYYYSICGIIAIVIYGVYKYLKMNKKITFKKFILDGLNFVSPMLIGVLMSTIITIPTFQVLLSGRGETFNTITIKDLLIPVGYIKHYLYEPYGIGLTSIILFSLLAIFDKNKENKFLSIILLLFAIFPVFNYILNATMYIDAKSLIPLLPVCIYTIVLAINKVIKEEINYKYVVIIFIVLSLLGCIGYNKYYLCIIDISIVLISLILYKKTKKELLLLIPICLFAIGLSIGMSKTNDELTNRNQTTNEYNKIEKVIDYITEKDNDYYRMNLAFGSKYNNRVFHNLKYYNTSIYSSTYNMEYNVFYHDVINNNFNHRNRVITSPSENVMYNILASQKYLISKYEKDIKGYELQEEKEGYYIYVNENVLPMVYATSQIINYSDFENLKYPYQSEALLNTIIVDEQTSSEFVPNIKRIEIDYSRFTTKDIIVRKENNHYLIHSNGSGEITYELDSNYKNDLLFIRFKNNESQSCNIGDTYITINDIKNKLTCKEWKYHNQNYDFDYVISNSDLDKLTIEFNKGAFDISDIEVYSLDYAYLEGLNNKIDKLNITTMIGNKLEGNIEVTKKGYLATTIPYDKGFTAYVDGKEVAIEKVNVSFVGFKIDEGKHNIKIVYKTPLKNICLITSSIGFIILIIVYYLELKRKI